MGNKVIRCIVYDIPMSKNDAGFGSRLISWSFAYYLSSLTNFKYKILIRKDVWPELSFIKLPNTKAVENLSQSVNYFEDEMFVDLYRSFTDQSNFNKFDDNLLMFHKVDDWTIGEWFDYSLDFHQIAMNPLKEVKFLVPELNDYFKGKFQKYVGVHIRRGPGVWTTKEDFESIPEQFRSYYGDILKERKWWRGVDIDNDNDNDIVRQSFIRDEHYFKTFDKILKINPKQKFYISTDIPVEALEYYKDKYDIVTQKDYFYNFVELCISKCKENYDEELFYGDLYILRYLFDFFVLSNTKFTILSKGSAWSDCVSMINPNLNYTPLQDNFVISKRLIETIKD